MIDRERLIKKMDEIFAWEFIADGSETERVLAALEAAGYAWYRVEDARFAYQTSALARTYAVTVDPDEADALLVPVGGDS